MVEERLRIDDLSSFMTEIDKQTKLPIYRKDSCLNYLLRSSNPNYDMVKALQEFRASFDVPNEENLKTLEIVVKFNSSLSIIPHLLNNSPASLSVDVSFLVKVPFSKDESHLYSGLCYFMDMKLDNAVIKQLVMKGNDITATPGNTISPLAYAVS